MPDDRYYAAVTQYRAMAVRTGPKDRRLHLIPDDAEASLCGIPRAALGPAGKGDDVVCADCLAWLPRRSALSGKFPRVRRP